MSSTWTRKPNALIYKPSWGMPKTRSEIIKWELSYWSRKKMLYKNNYRKQPSSQTMIESRKPLKLKEIRNSPLKHLVQSKQLNQLLQTLHNLLNRVLQSQLNYKTSRPSNKSNTSNLKSDSFITCSTKPSKKGPDIKTHKNLIKTFIKLNKTT